MDSRTFRYLILVGVLPVMLAVASCDGEPFGPDGGNEADDRITLVVSVPEARASATRAITGGSGEDNRVDEITVLFFDATAPYNYAGSASVNSAGITDAGTAYANGGHARKRFAITKPEGARRALFLANAAGHVAKISGLAGKTLAGIQSELTVTIDAGRKYDADPESDGYEPFVMASAVETIDPEAGVDYAVNPVELARHVAKINVTVDDAVTNFSIREIVLCDYAIATAICPADAPGATRPEAPALASGAGNGISYGGNAITDGKACVDEIFTFERPVATGTEKNLSLLIRGDATVDGMAHEDRWYKLELLKTDPADGALKNVDVLRNYAYTLNVVSVAGIGHGTREGAYAAPAVGITVQMDAAYGEEGMNEGVYNGQYQLTVNRSTIVVGAAAATETLKIYTDYEGGWAIAMTGGENEDGWLSLSQTSTSSANTAASTHVTITTRQNTGDTRKATLRITAGTLKKDITVIQLNE